MYITSANSTFYFQYAIHKFETEKQNAKYLREISDSVKIFPCVLNHIKNLCYL